MEQNSEVMFNTNLSWSSKSIINFFRIDAIPREKYDRESQQWQNDHTHKIFQYNSHLVRFYIKISRKDFPI